MKKTWRLLAFVIIMAALCSAATVPAKYDELKFQTIDVPGAVYTDAFGISPNGDIVGNYNTPDGVQHAYVWLKGEALQPRDAGPFTLFQGITPGGGTIVGAYGAPGTCPGCPYIQGRWHGFVWTGENLTTIDIPGSTYTHVTRISPNGDVVGEYVEDVSSGDPVNDMYPVHGFVLSAGTFKTIEFPDVWSSVYGINARGDIAGWYGTFAEGIHAFVLINGEMTNIDPPGSTMAFSNDINASGDVVGGYYDTEFTAHGFLWSRGVYNKMDIPGSIGTQTWGINDRGDIVGSYLTEDGIWHGFVTYKYRR